MNRNLRLRRETLSELSTADLRDVAAGTDTSVVTVLRTSRCPLANLFSGMYPSINMDCTSALDLVDTSCC